MMPPSGVAHESESCSVRGCGVEVTSVCVCKCVSQGVWAKCVGVYVCAEGREREGEGE